MTDTASMTDERSGRKTENPIEDWDKNAQATSLLKVFEFDNAEDASGFARRVFTISSRTKQAATVTCDGGNTVSIALPIEGKSDRGARVMARRLKNVATGKPEDEGAEPGSE